MFFIGHEVSDFLKRRKKVGQKNAFGRVPEALFV